MSSHEQPSRQTLEQIVSRIITFTVGVARYPAIAAILAHRGYDPEVHDFAWDRLKKLGTLPTGKETKGVSDKVVSHAVAELDAWDEPNFEIISIILENAHPHYAKSLFKDLEAKQGKESIQGVATLLARLDEVEGSKDPEAAAVIALLGARGYPKEERQRLQGLVDITTKYAPTAPVTDTERTKILTELYAWHREWSTIAKRDISRRQYLIALGLASPRKAATAKPGSEGAGQDGSGVTPAAPGGNGTSKPVTPAGANN